MTHQPGPDLDLDAITARATSEHLTPGPWTLAKEGCDCGGDYPCGHGLYVTGIITPTPTWSAAERAKRTGEQPRDYDFHRSDIGDFTTADWELMAHAREDVPALLAEIRRLQQQRRYLTDQLAKKDAASGAGDRALREFLTAAEPDTDLAAADNPTPLRWGLNDVLWGDDDTITVLLSGPDGEPYWLELDPERAAVLREDLAGPDAGETHIAAHDSDDPEHTDDRPGCPPAPAGR